MEHPRDSDGHRMAETACGLGAEPDQRGARSAIAPIPRVTTKPVHPSNPDVWPPEEWEKIQRIMRGEEE